MDNAGTTGITITMLLISSVVMGATIFNVTSNETEGNISENDLAELAQQLTDDTVDEITTYLKTPYILGKYYGSANHQKIEKIVINVESWISKDINMSELTIELYNENSVRILSYSGYAEAVESNDVFEHPIWNSITDYNFGIIVSHDKDNSLVDYDIINDRTDMAFLSIKLPENMAMSKGDIMTVILSPSNGITRTLELEAPLPMKSVVNFGL